MKPAGFSLNAIVYSAQNLHQVRKRDLHAGDHIIVKTNNSVYTISMIDQQWCFVRGGWFDRKGLSPMKTRITGCTWGGSAIKVDIVAACGLCLEFSNRLVTTTINRIIIFPSGSQN